MESKTNKFYTDDGNFIQFGVKNDTVYILEGQGKNIQTVNKMGINAARNIALDILGIDESDRKFIQTKEDAALIQMLNEAPNTEKYRQARKVLNEDSNLSFNKPRGAEKILEDVVQDVYEVFGFDKFLLRDFRELFDSKYSKSTARKVLYDMNKAGWVRKYQVENKEGLPNRTEYYYALSNKSRKIIGNLGRIDSKRNPIYRNKSVMKDEKD